MQCCWMKVYNELSCKVLLCVWLPFPRSRLAVKCSAASEVAGRGRARAYVLRCKTIPFTRQNHTFWRVKPYLLRAKTSPFVCRPMRGTRCGGCVLKARGAERGGKKRGEYLAISANSPIFVPSTAVNGGAAESAGAELASAGGRQRASRDFLLFIYSNITRCL